MASCCSRKAPHGNNGGISEEKRGKPIITIERINTLEDLDNLPKGEFIFRVKYIAPEVKEKFVFSQTIIL